MAYERTSLGMTKKIEFKIIENATSIKRYGTKIGSIPTKNDKKMFSIIERLKIAGSFFFCIKIFKIQKSTLYHQIKDPKIYFSILYHND